MAKNYDNVFECIDEIQECIDEIQECIYVVKDAYEEDYDVAYNAALDLANAATCLTEFVAEDKEEE